MNESTSRLVTTHRARARSSRPLSPFHRARRASRDRIDDRGTESTIARANHTECDDFHAEPVHRPPYTFASLETFVRSRHRAFVAFVAVVAVSRARRHSFMHARHACTACIRGRARGGGATTSHDSSYHFSCLFPPQTVLKKIKKINTRAKSTRDPHGGGYTRVMTQHQHIERNTHLPRRRARDIKK